MPVWPNLSKSFFEMEFGPAAFHDFGILELSKSISGQCWDRELGSSAMEHTRRGMNAAGWEQHDPGALGHS